MLILGCEILDLSGELVLLGEELGSLLGEPVVHFHHSPIHLDLILQNGLLQFLDLDLKIVILDPQIPHHCIMLFDL